MYYAVDYCLSSLFDVMKARIILCGDFNDLCLYSDDICNSTGLKQIVNFPTLGDNCLDLIFTNFGHDQLPSCLSPAGNSDHGSIFQSPIGVDNVLLKKRVRKFSQSSFASFQSYICSID